MSWNLFCNCFENVSTASFEKCQRTSLLISTDNNKNRFKYIVGWMNVDNSSSGSHEESVSTGLMPSPGARLALQTLTLNRTRVPEFVKLEESQNTFNNGKYEKLSDAWHARAMWCRIYEIRFSKSLNIFIIVFYIFVLY